jgi:Ras family
MMAASLLTCLSCGVLSVDYKDAAAAIFTFDVTQPATLLRVARWIEEVKKKTANRTMVFVIAACKCDLPASPGLMEEGRRLANQHRAEFIETSAKDDFGTSEAFSRTAQRVLSCQKEAVNGNLPPIAVTIGGGVLVIESSDPVNASTVSTEDTVVEEEQVKTKRTKKNVEICEGTLLACGSDDRGCSIM